jgi:hypothetical protein
MGMTKQIPDVGKGESSVIVARWPNGEWSYGGHPNDSAYEEAELFLVWYNGWLDPGKVKRKAQSYRSRQLKKAQGEKR